MTARANTWKTTTTPACWLGHLTPKPPAVGASTKGKSARRSVLSRGKRLPITAPTRRGWGSYASSPDPPTGSAGGEMPPLAHGNESPSPGRSRAVRAVEPPRSGARPRSCLRTVQRRSHRCGCVVSAGWSCRSRASSSISCVVACRRAADVRRGGVDAADLVRANRGQDRAGQLARASSSQSTPEAWRTASASTRGDCAPLTMSRSAMTKVGTARMPRSEARRSSVRTSAA